MNHTTPNLLSATAIAKAVSADIDTTPAEKAPLQTWRTTFADMLPVAQTPDSYTAADIHQLAADGLVTPRYEGGIPGWPRRTLYDLDEVRKAIGHTSRLPKVDEDQAEEQPKPQLADLQLAQHRTGVAVHDLIAGIRQGILTDHSQPKVMVQDGETVYVPTEPLLDVDEVKRQRGELSK